MSTFWSLFIIVGTLGSLVWTLWLLLSNRSKATGDRRKRPATTSTAFEEYDNPLPLWWVGLFVATIVFAVGYLLYYPGLGNFAGLGGWTSHAQWQARRDGERSPRSRRCYASVSRAMSEAQLHESHQAQQIGRRLFLNYCASCHGMQRARRASAFRI